MALHRDIFWVGRQWAVTGAGIQAVDQRLRGVLDIEIARLWDDALVQSRRAKPKQVRQVVVVHCQKKIERIEVRGGNLARAQPAQVVVAAGCGRLRS